MNNLERLEIIEALAELEVVSGDLFREELESIKRKLGNATQCDA